jgi:UDP-perosamine 4-acetyltransferase
MTDVVFVGGGGHASVLLEIARQRTDLRIVGYVAPEGSALSAAGVEWLGGDDDAGALHDRGIHHAILGAAGVHDNDRRSRLFEAWNSLGFGMISLVHRSAVVSPGASYGPGLQCMALAAVNPGSVLGANVVVNTGAIVEHDCVIEDHVLLGPGAVLCGGVRVGRGALVGAGATVLPGISLAPGAIVAAGSVVTRDVAERMRVGGVPARPMPAIHPVSPSSVRT